MYNVNLRLASGERKRWRQIAAAVAGNSLEWFDLVVYGYFASVIAPLFFPAGDPKTSLLFSFGAFGLSFVVRPVGALVLGRFADRNGRKPALLLSTLLMLIGTAAIAVLPTYETIGIAAPILLIAARLLQGFSVGGEFGSATAFLIEQAGPRRALYSSWQFASQGLAILLATSFGALLTATLDEADLSAWGWRVPFVFGLLIGPAAYLIRRYVAETPAFEASRGSAGRPPMGQSLATFSARVVVGTMLVIGSTAALYLIVYMPTLVHDSLGLPRSYGYISGIAASLALIVVSPLSGALADRHGLIATAVPAALGSLVLTPLLLLWLSSAPDFTRLLVVQLAQGVVLAAYWGPLAALLPQLFPVGARATGVALAYNFAVLLAGGFAPVAFALLIDVTGASAAPGAYVAVAAGVSLLALIEVRRRRWLLEI